MGYNFKSDIIFYNILSNKNGKLTYQVNKNSILILLMKPQIMTRVDFILEKDGNSGHDSSEKNLVYI